MKKRIIECKFCQKEKVVECYQQKFCSNKCRNDFWNADRARLVELGRKVEA